MSCRAASQGLKALETEESGLAGILVTHEHSDHVSGLAVFLKRHAVPVYGSAATLDYLSDHALVPAGTELIAVDGRDEDVCGFGVQSFATSHDSADCRGYRITTPLGKTLSIATDLGFVSDEVMANLLLSDMVALEANYDLRMLMEGSYPYYLKTRIASKRGHLCNDESAASLVRLAENGCKRFLLCHISQENNTPELVEQTVCGALLAHGAVPEQDCVVRPARRHTLSEVFAF